MLFVLVGLCFLLVNASNEYPEALAKCTTYEPVSREYIDFNGRYNANLDLNSEFSYAACYDLVVEPNNVNVRYESQRTFAGKNSRLPLRSKVRLALAAGRGKNKDLNSEFSYAACYDLVVEPNNVNVRYESQRTFAGKNSRLPLRSKVRLALAAGRGKNKIMSLAPQTIYGCNSWSTVRS
ncbi:fibroin P25 [Cooperia oncophora]